MHFINLIGHASSCAGMHWPHSCIVAPPCEWNGEIAPVRPPSYLMRRGRGEPTLLHSAIRCRDYHCDRQMRMVHNLTGSGFGAFEFLLRLFRSNTE